MNWALFRNSLKSKFNVEVVHDEWVGLTMLLSLKAAFHDGTGYAPHLFAPQSKRIDKLWHRYILTSPYYYELWCKQIFGVSIHHTSLTSEPDRKRCRQNAPLAIEKVWPNGGPILVPIFVCSQLASDACGQAGICNDRHE